MDLEQTASPMPQPPPEVAGQAATDDHANSGHQLCAECASREQQASVEQLVYAIGRIEARFASLGLEREFQQRLTQTPTARGEGMTRGRQVRTVLETHGHLAMRACYVFTIGGIPAYIVAPVGAHTRAQLLEALEHSGDPDYVCVLIGRRGPLSSPSTCGGLLAPIVACDQLYCFSLAEWRADLEKRLAPALRTRKAAAAALHTASRELFELVAHSTENLGATDSHRALNYALVQHPGIFLAAAERAEGHILERVEARAVHGLGSRRQVAVILTFVDTGTAVAERLFTRIDVTEEWPFLADTPEGGRVGLGLAPFVESGAFGLGF